MKVPAHLRHGPFTFQEALSAGVGRGSLTGKNYMRLFRGVYVCADLEVTHRVLVAAALKSLPAATVASGVTGLWSYGVEVGNPRPLTFYSTHPHEVARPGIVVHRVGQLPPHQGSLATPGHCWTIAAKRLGLLDLVAAGDWLVHRGLTSATALEVFAQIMGTPHGPTRIALRLIRHGAESPRETRLRLMLVLAGLPEPACNVAVRDDVRFIGRGDLVLEGLRMVIEYDGRQHLSNVAQWERDVVRLDAFANAGWHVTRVTHARLAQPRELVTHIYAVMVARGYRGPTPRFDDRWCSLFGDFA